MIVREYRISVPMKLSKIRFFIQMEAPKLGVLFSMFSILLLKLERVYPQHKPKYNICCAPLCVYVCMCACLCVCVCVCVVCVCVCVCVFYVCVRLCVRA